METPAPRLAQVTSVVALPGGAVAQAWRVSYADGTTAVAKTLPDAPGDLFPIEAEGLRALQATGHVRTPGVVAVTSGLLLLQALCPRPDDPCFWELLARDLATLHRGTTHDRFGWHHDGYLGRLPQGNRWTADGHAFFAEHRLLRYLDEPLTQQVLTAADRRALERLCGRLPEIIPPMPPVLTHGDLWSQNVLAGPDGHPVVIDPAVSYTWAEVDLSMMWCARRPPEADRFFRVYQDLAPSPPGWAERMPVLHLRELLSCLAHDGGGAGGTADQVRGILAPFRAHGSGRQSRQSR